MALSLWNIIKSPIGEKRIFKIEKSILKQDINFNPYTGKTTISQLLSKIFHLPIVDIKSVVDFGKAFANIKLDNKPQEEKKENQNPEPINENNNEANNNENSENKEKIDTQRRTSEEIIKEKNNNIDLFN